MRILIISQYYWPENFRINDVAKLLVNNGIEVSVLTGYPNYPSGVLFEGYKKYAHAIETHPDGYLVYRVPLALRGKASSFRLVLNYLSFIINGIIFGSRLLAGVKFDLIFVYAPSPILQAIVGIYLKYSRKVPLITWVQDLWPDSIKFTGHIKNNAALSIISKIVSWIYDSNDLLLAQSKSFIKAIKDKSNSVEIIYFPTPGEHQTSVSLASNMPEFFLDPGFNVVFAGNLGSVQSLPMILDAAEILMGHPNIRIILVGSGSLSQWLASEVESRNLKNVLLAGRYPAEAMPAIYERASALLVSLNRDPVLNQTVPAKLQSYLAAGKPIIASLDGEGAHIVVQAKAGLVCATEDPVALANAVLRLSAMSHDQLEGLGAAGRRYFAQNFEPQALVRELIGIFSETISRKLDEGDHAK